MAEIIVEQIEGIRDGSTLYVMGDNLYSREKSYNGILTVRCIHHKASTKHCKARAQMDEPTLRVIKRTEEHTCEQDPDQKIQLMLESEMKQLATTTGDSLRKIYDDVSLENPRVAVKIGYPRLEAAMPKRREKTNLFHCSYRHNHASLQTYCLLHLC